MQILRKVPYNYQNHFIRKSYTSNIKLYFIHYSKYPEMYMVEFFERY